MSRYTEIDFLKIEDLVSYAASYMKYVRTLLEDSDIDDYLYADNEMDRLISRTAALTKFAMLQEFSISLNKYVGEIEEYVSELNKQYNKQFKEQAQNDKRSSGINN